jgi:hypothetical protein
MESKWYVSRPSNSRPLVVLHHADDGEDLSVCLRISNAETVGSDCENPWLGYAYCVEGPASATTSVKPTATNPGLTGAAIRRTPPLLIVAPPLLPTRCTSMRCMPVRMHAYEDARL